MCISDKFAGGADAAGSAITRLENLCSVLSTLIAL